MKNFLGFIRYFRTASPSLQRFVLMTLYKAALYDAFRWPANAGDRLSKWHGMLDHTIAARHREIARRWNEERQK